MPNNILMEKSPSTEVKIGTRTYFYNLLQASSQTLMIIDCTRELCLDQIGINTVKPDLKKLLEKTDPPGVDTAEEIKETDLQDLSAFEDLSTIEKFLSTSREEFLSMVEECIDEPKQKKAFSNRKRTYNYLIGNKTDIAHYLLTEIQDQEKNKETDDKSEQPETPSQSIAINPVYQNFFQITVPQILSAWKPFLGALSSNYKPEVLDHMKTSLQREVRYLLLALLFTVSLSGENPESYLLKRGHQGLLQKYPFFCPELDKKLFRELKRPQALPNEIIDGYVYLGNGRHAADLNVIRLFGFTHVLNVTVELANYFETSPENKQDKSKEGQVAEKDTNRITYLKLPIEDYETEDLSVYFQEAYSFIESAREREGKILIHCVLGRSRSFAILVMFIMKKYGLGFEQANEVVNERRFLGQVNLGFEEQLIEFEKRGFRFKEEVEGEEGG